LCPEYAEPVGADIETAHKKLWRRLRRDVNLDTLRVCHGISGVAGPEIVPEEVYVSEIERCLNPRPVADFFAFKGGYNRWFKNGVFPNAFIHNVEGSLYDNKYMRIGADDIRQIAETLEYPVVVKPNIDSFGGADVAFISDSNSLLKHIDGRRNYIVQERIKPHPYFGRFSPVGINTLRVCLYRSVETNELHILNVALRMGQGGSLDNETAGGIVCYINDDGRLNSYAVDKYGVKCDSHPDCGLRFDQQEPIPNFEDMKKLAVEVAHGVFLARLISLDLCLDSEGTWRAIEINIFCQTIRFAQYAGHPFFGEFTEEVVRYCEEERKV
jgi:hypothetical protein